MAEYLGCAQGVTLETVFEQDVNVSPQIECDQVHLKYSAYIEYIVNRLPLHMELIECVYTVSLLFIV